MEKSVVLLSGGLDSTTVLAICQSEGFEPYPLTIDYGQRHSIELNAAASTAALFQVRAHKVVKVDLASIGGSALTDDLAVPKNRGAAEMGDIPITYVPARNTVMLSVALGYAETLGSDHIFVGVNAVDYSGYPDCRPEFIRAFENMANLATKRGVEGHRLQIHAPLIHLTKVQIIQRGTELGVDYGMTHSCYDPSPDGRACGECDACLIRKLAFKELGMEDPVLAPA